jgi:hypothetical protein
MKLPISKLTTNLNNIQALPDVVKGQATTLKATFDESGNEIKAYVNTVLTEELNSVDGSKKIGHNSPNIGSDNVGDALEEIQGNIVAVVAGSIPDNSITDAKLSNSAGQVKPRLAQLQSDVTTIDGDVSTVVTNLSNFEDDFEYPLATVVSREIQIPKLGTNKVSRFKLDADIATGASITISLDGGATSLPLRNIANEAILELEKGFYEVIADATFFTLRPSGASLKEDVGLNVAFSAKNTNFREGNMCVDGDFFYTPYAVSTTRLGKLNKKDLINSSDSKFIIIDKINEIVNWINDFDKRLDKCKITLQQYENKLNELKKK